MKTRRDFLKTGTLAGGAALAGSAFFNHRQALGAKPNYFGLHPFIEANPDAVFIKRTNVQSIYDSEAKLREGQEFAREVFFLKESDGIPLTHKIVVKPNAHPSISNFDQGFHRDAAVPENAKPIKDGMGIDTDVYFTEGVIRGMQEKLGLKKFYIKECLGPQDWELRGWIPMAKRVGADMTKPPADIRKARPDEVNYTDIPDGMIFSRYCHLSPTNESDTWLFNIAKMKAHGMCMTQAVKNCQGLGAPLYVHMCQTIPSIKTYPKIMQENIIPGFDERVTASWERHLKEGYPRWEVNTSVTPLRLETWAHRTLDHLSVTPRGFNVIEAIYARNGSFMNGRDILANYLIFGMNPFRMDIIGLWLGGHEPGNIGFNHIAVERGFLDTVNPWEIPIYDWVDGEPFGPKELNLFNRVPLLTYYLVREKEPYFHLVNEPFDYDKWAKKHKREI